MDTIIPTLGKYFSDKLRLVFAVMLIIMIGMWCTNVKDTRPVIHTETETFMAFYGNPTGGFWSEVAKFFDPTPTDWDNYQARELSYVFEYIDAQMVILLNKIPFFSYGFRSISQIAFVILTTIVLYFIIRELLPTFRRTSCAALAMLFPLSPQLLVMYGVYFRCGKIIGAFWAALWIFYLIRWLKPGAQPRGLIPYILLSLGAFLSFITDKQGVMIGLWLIGLSLLIAVIRRRHGGAFRHLIHFAVSFSVAFGFYLGWDYLLCPYIINAVRGHPPFRGWSSLNFFLLHDQASYMRGIWNGFKLTVLQLQLAFGNIWDGSFLSRGFALASYILITISAIKKTPGTSANANENSRQGLTDRVALVLMLITAFVFCVFMIMLLYMRHTPLAWADIWRGGYYYQSATLILIIGLLIVFSLLSRRNRSKAFETVMVCAVFLMCMANYFSLRTTRDHGDHGHMKDQVKLNQKFDQEIRSKQVTEDSRFLMKYIFAPASERHALYVARPRRGDGVNLKILKNDEQIWPEDGWTYCKDSADRQHHDFEVEVSSGDKIFFHVNMVNGTPHDSTYWDPTIRYEDGTVYQASKGFSGTQGKNGWHYQYEEGGNYANLIYAKPYKTWKHEDPERREPSLNSTKQHPGHGIDCVRVFVVPKAGTVRITGAPVCVGTPY